MRESSYPHPKSTCTSPIPVTATPPRRRRNVGCMDEPPTRPTARRHAVGAESDWTPPVMWPDAGSGFEADPFSPAGMSQQVWRVTGRRPRQSQRDGGRCASCASSSPWRSSPPKSSIDGGVWRGRGRPVVFGVRVIGSKRRPFPSPSSPGSSVPPWSRCSCWRRWACSPRRRHRRSPWCRRSRQRVTARCWSSAEARVAACTSSPSMNSAATWAHHFGCGTHKIVAYDLGAKESVPLTCTGPEADFLADVSSDDWPALTDQGRARRRTRSQREAAWARSSVRASASRSPTPVIPSISLTRLPSPSSPRARTSWRP